MKWTTGAEIKRLRKKLKLTQAEAARRTGITQGYQSQLEKMKRVENPLLVHIWTNKWARNHFLVEGALVAKPDRRA